MSRVTSSTRARASAGSAGQPRLEPLQLGAADVVEPLAERDDGRNRPARTLPHREARHFLRDDRFGARDLGAAPRQVLLHDALQVVDVVEEHLLDLADGRIDVARHGHVDDEQRLGAPASGDRLRRRPA